MSTDSLSQTAALPAAEATSKARSAFRFNGGALTLGLYLIFLILPIY